jgi:hypothetical protein
VSILVESAAAATARVAARAGNGAWRVVATTFVTLGLAYGFWYSYSVFLVAFLREFGWSRSVVAGAFSLSGHRSAGWSSASVRALSSRPAAPSSRPRSSGATPT